jgi:hypothetical protein
MPTAPATLRHNKKVNGSKPADPPGAATLGFHEVWMMDAADYARSLLIRKNAAVSRSRARPRRAPYGRDRSSVEHGQR